MNQILLTDEMLTELRVFMLMMKARLQGDILRYGDDTSPEVVNWVKGCREQLAFAVYIYDAAEGAIAQAGGAK